MKKWRIIFTKHYHVKHETYFLITGFIAIVAGLVVALFQYYYLGG